MGCLQLRPKKLKQEQPQQQEEEKQESITRNESTTKSMSNPFNNKNNSARLTIISPSLVSTTTSIPRISAPPPLVEQQLACAEASSSSSCVSSSTSISLSRSSSVALVDVTVSDITRSAIKSQAQLEYEFENCIEHFNRISRQLRNSSTSISSEFDRELLSDEYFPIYSQTAEQDPVNSKELLINFETFFGVVRQALMLLPMIVNQCCKFEERLCDRKQEVDMLRNKVKKHLSFCQSVHIPPCDNLQLEKQEDI